MCQYCQAVSHRMSIPYSGFMLQTNGLIFTEHAVAISLKQWDILVRHLVSHPMTDKMTDLTHPMFS